MPVPGLDYFERRSGLVWTANFQDKRESVLAVQKPSFKDDESRAALGDFNPRQPTMDWGRSLGVVSFEENWLGECGVAGRPFASSQSSRVKADRICSFRRDPMLSELLSGSKGNTEAALEAKEGESAVDLDWFVLQGASHGSRPSYRKAIPCCTRRVAVQDESSPSGRVFPLPELRLGNLYISAEAPLQPEILRSQRLGLLVSSPAFPFASILT
ncbi:uncharacterized protein CLUP02_04490 [Colletotrichum lupini]|uniref:Uncharacterized protein n=1 Tax=Colletotrichum lupini TaxID=145971 RepID=A0A9Q8WDC8_9PEZI|nr:uncharacterized protein CLUP02_04490 [Colletotrichum lupini]UQC79011.1 hypothetical protein CLUP02_04490 [Colletotrichum lupini]